MRDHNNHTDDPRFEGLPASTVEQASQVHCSRCKEQIVASSALTGTVMVNYYVVALGVRERVVICGKCGLLLRELLHPEVLDDPMYRATVDQLRSTWT